MNSTQQQGLFEDTESLADEVQSAEVQSAKAPSSRKPSTILPVAPSLENIQLGARMHSQLHLGTSSWSFPGWNGLVYDGDFRDAQLARDGLPAYAAHPLFGCVGIDRTFYAPIAEADYRKYAGQVGEDFRFLVKAPMAITSSYLRDENGNFSDSPYFLDVGYAVNEFIAPCTAGLESKAGPLVFQFPPLGRAVREPDVFINRLYRFLKALPTGPLYAVEMRDPELLTHRFFMCLKTTGVRFCVASHARMPSPRRQIALAEAVLDAGAFVARWSLHSGFRYEDAKSRYFPFNKLVDEDLDSRDGLAEASAKALEAGFPVYIVINNKAEGSAPLSIAMLAHRIDGLIQHTA
ncbi:MAG: DUF72 domain-containing protein [Betaproteobacteria bacterium]